MSSACWSPRRVMAAMERRLAGDITRTGLDFVCILNWSDPSDDNL